MICPITGLLLIGIMQSGKVVYDGNILLLGTQAAGITANIFTILFIS
jgi:hypothetical protein